MFSGKERGTSESRMKCLWPNTAWSYITTAEYLHFESLLLQGFTRSPFLPMSTENSHVGQGRVWIRSAQTQCAGGTCCQHHGELGNRCTFFTPECVFCTVNSFTANAK